MANDYPHMTNNAVLAAEIEGTEGTAETFVDADFDHFVSNIRFSPNIAKYIREGSTGDLGTLPAVIGSQLGTISFTCELKGSGTGATDDPELHDLLMGCGRQQETVEQITIGAVTGGPFVDGETITGGTSSATGVVYKATANGTTTLLFVTTSGTFQSGEVVTGSNSAAYATTSSAPSDYGLLYRPDSDGGSSITLAAYYVYDQGNAYATAVELAGARGTCEIVASDVDSPVLLNFSFTGKLSAIENRTNANPNPSPDYYPPLPFLGTTLTAFGYEPDMSSISINLNNTVTPRKTCQEETGIRSCWISKRDPGGNFKPEMTRIADWDPYSILTGVTDGSIGFELIDSAPTAGRGVEVHCPHCNIEDLGIEDQDGITLWAPEFKCHKTSFAGFTDRDVMLLFR